jgi:hypothetical protein
MQCQSASKDLDSARMPEEKERNNIKKGGEKSYVVRIGVNR